MGPTVTRLVQDPLAANSSTTDYTLPIFLSALYFQIKYTIELPKNNIISKIMLKQKVQSPVYNKRLRETPKNVSDKLPIRIKISDLFTKLVVLSLS